jgi:DNA polymerase V
MGLETYDFFEKTNIFMRFTIIKSSKNLQVYAAMTETVLELKYVQSGISAGFPSPADDFLDAGIDLNQELIKHPYSTFYGRVKGDSMRDVGIHNGDILIIDKSLEASNGRIAVCFIDGEFTVKKIKIEQNCCWLMPANENYKPIKVTSDNEFLIWGVVINVIKYF